MVWNIGGNISWGDGVKRQGIATLCLLRSFLFSEQKELEEASLLCSCFGGVCGDFKSLSITWKWSTIWATAQVFCSLFWNSDRKSGYLYFWSKYIKFKALIQQNTVRNIHWPQKWDLLGSLKRSCTYFCGLISVNQEVWNEIYQLQSRINMRKQFLMAISVSQESELFQMYHPWHPQKRCLKESLRAGSGCLQLFRIEAIRFCCVIKQNGHILLSFTYMSFHSNQWALFVCVKTKRSCFAI